ncbi:MAG: glycosyltransferase family 2 protein [Candidatus Falkowbacteria bacterium]
MPDYLKVSSATDLQGRDRFLYRALEILPATLAWVTLIVLTMLSWFKPIWVAFFIIAFDVYWLLLVMFLGLHLISAYRSLRKNVKIDWKTKCQSLSAWKKINHLIILPVYNEGKEIVQSALKSLLNDGYPTDKMIVVLTTEERGGAEVLNSYREITNNFKNKFGKFLFTVHPDGMAGELKGKGANQNWAARQVKKEIIDKQGFDYNNIIVSVFDIDTIVTRGYFYRLTHSFLTVADRHKVSYQPVPVYNNNLWEAPFFARVAAMSNTFWQMMQQIRQEKLATYSSHSMSWKALVEIDFWSTNMVSEDSRIFWHCYCHYNSNYRVEPLYFPVSMDVVMDKTSWQTMRNLYKQQRRWGWGVENVPYLVFNIIKRWKNMKKGNALGRIFTQVYGFHSWATNALIIAVIGWLPLFIGGDDFTATVLSGNLPVITRTLMTLAMAGLVLSAIISTLLLPKRPKHYSFFKYLIMPIQWIILPISIIIFGAIPALESQTRMSLGGKWRLGFWVTPKER